MTAETSVCKVDNPKPLQKLRVSKYWRSDSSVRSRHKWIEASPEFLSKVPRAYSDWKQVAGYFDGDGNVNVKIMKFTLLFRLDWTDTDMNQIKQLKQFLLEKGVPTSRILAYKPNRGKTAYSLRIATIESVLSVAESLVPFCYKKAYELRLCPAYLRDQIAGREVVLRLNKLVRAGIRSGDIRIARHLSFMHSKGVWLARVNGSKAAVAVNSVLSAIQRDSIKRMYRSGQFTTTLFAREFGVSKNTIQWIVRN